MTDPISQSISPVNGTGNSSNNVILVSVAGQDLLCNDLTKIIIVLATPSRIESRMSDLLIKDRNLSFSIAVLQISSLKKTSAISQQSLI
jgi:hypothetical protein